MCFTPERHVALLWLAVVGLFMRYYAERAYQNMGIIQGTVHNNIISKDR